jgi:hypothetical protein
VKALPTERPRREGVIDETDTNNNTKPKEKITRQTKRKNFFLASKIEASLCVNHNTPSSPSS